MIGIVVINRDGKLTSLFILDLSDNNPKKKKLGRSEANIVEEKSKIVTRPTKK